MGALRVKMLRLTRASKRFDRRRPFYKKGSGCKLRKLNELSAAGRID
jgi:hypothetical protein